MRAAVLAGVLIGYATFGAADETPIGTAAVVNTISVKEGLAAWRHIYAVASHPRCTNCHVGDQQKPMWEGLGYGRATVHGMNVRAGDSRIGAETIPCRTCHLTQTSANSIPHAPPHILEAWRLPPVELAWLGKSSAEVCAQLKNPETNDDHTVAELAGHVTASPFVLWSFEPGGARRVPQGTASDLATALTKWGAAGMPCPPA